MPGIVGERRKTEAPPSPLRSLNSFAPAHSLLLPRASSENKLSRTIREELYPAGKFTIDRVWYRAGREPAYPPTSEDLPVDSSFHCGYSGI